MVSASLGSSPTRKLDRRAGGEFDASVGEVTGTHLGARQVREYSDRPTGPVGGRPDVRDTVDVVGELAVAEIEPHHVDTGLDQLDERRAVMAGGTDRGHDLRSPRHGAYPRSPWSCS